MEKFQDSSFSQQAHQTTDGNETRKARYANSSKLPRGVTEEMADTVVQMYVTRAGSAPEIARAMRMAQSTVYRVLQVRKTPLHYPLKSISAQKGGLTRRAKAAPVEPEFMGAPAVDYVPEPPKPKRTIRRKKKSLWQRLISIFR